MLLRDFQCFFKKAFSAITFLDRIYCILRTVMSNIDKNVFIWPKKLDNLGLILKIF
jgi:hypothetical protein